MTPFVFRAPATGPGKPLPLALAGLPDELLGRRCHYLRKELAKVGEYVHRGTGKAFAITRERMDGWIRAFKKRAGKGIKAPLTKQHTLNPKADDAVGYVVALSRSGDSLYADLQFIGDDALALAARNDVSLCAVTDVLDGDGDKHAEAIDHIALTPIPALTNLGGYVKIAASASPFADNPVFELAANCGTGAGGFHEGNTCATGGSGGTKASAPPGAYASISDFEKDYEPIGATGRALMAYAGVSHEYDDTHRMSVPDMLEKVTDEKRNAFRLQPGKSREAAEYTNLVSAKAFIELNARNDAGVAKDIKNIRGPWAVKYVEQMAPGGELSKQTHRIAERTKEFAEHSKPYKARPKKVAAAMSGNSFLDFLAGVSPKGAPMPFAFEPELGRKLRDKLALGADVPDEQVAVVAAEHVAAAIDVQAQARKDAAQVTALSADVKRLQKELADANGKVLALSADAPKELDGRTLSLMRRQFKTDREKAVASGVISEAGMTAIDNLLGVNKPDGLALSLSAGDADGEDADMVYSRLCEIIATHPGIKTNAQIQRSRQLALSADREDGPISEERRRELLNQTPLGQVALAK